MTDPFVGCRSAVDWRATDRTNAAIDADGVTVARDPLPTFRSASAVDLAVLDAPVVDVAVEPCGTAFLLAADGTIARRDRNADRWCELGCVFDPADGGEPVAITVAGDDLLVADRASQRVQALSVYSLQTRWVAQVGPDPLALTASEGIAYLLEGGPPDAPRTTGQGRLRRIVSGRATTVVEGLYNPIDLASDDADTVVVLGERPAGEPFAKLFEPATLAAPGDGATADVRVGADAFRTTSGRRVRPRAIEAVDVGELLVGVADGGGAPTLLRYRPAVEAFERLDLFDAPIAELQTDPTGREAGLFVVTTAGEIARLDPDPERRGTHPADGRPTATVRVRLDSGERAMTWDRVRLAIDGDSGQTQVRLRYAATDDPTPAPNRTDPATGVEAIDGIGEVYGRRLRAAGIETFGDLLAHRPAAIALVLGTDEKTVSIAQTADVLATARQAVQPDIPADGVAWQATRRPDPIDAPLPDAEGRYLWIELEIVGASRSAPTVQDLRAYFPDRSLLDELPAIYREDRHSATLLERFLGPLESTAADLEEAIATTGRFTDPDGVPAAGLEWLAAFLAADSESAWPDAAVRALIGHAPALGRARGTRAGLLAGIRLYLRHAEDVPAPIDPDGPLGSRAAEAPVEDRSRPPVAGDAARVHPDLSVEPTDASDDRDTKADPAGDSDGTTPPRPPAVTIISHGDIACADDVHGAPFERLISCPAGFLVLLDPAVSRASAAAIDRYVEATQPAHATGQTVALREEIVLGPREETPADAPGHHTYLGVNSRLSTREATLGESTLGRDSELTGREPTGQYDAQVRLGVDARLS